MPLSFEDHQPGITTAGVIFQAFDQDGRPVVCTVTQEAMVEAFRLDVFDEASMKRVCERNSYFLQQYASEKYDRGALGGNVILTSGDLPRKGRKEQLPLRRKFDGLPTTAVYDGE